MGSELHRATTDAINKLTVHAFEHEEDEPLSYQKMCDRLRELTAQITEAGEKVSRRRLRLSMLELAAFAIYAASESDK